MLPLIFSNRQDHCPRIRWTSVKFRITKKRSLPCSPIGMSINHPYDIIMWSIPGRVSRYEMLCLFRLIYQVCRNGISVFVCNMFVRVFRPVLVKLICHINYKSFYTRRDCEVSVSYTKVEELANMAIVLLAEISLLLLLLVDNRFDIGNVTSS